MRVLFLSAWCPVPPRNGAKLRALNLLRALGSDHEIDLLCTARTMTVEDARTHAAALGGCCRTVDIVSPPVFDARSATGRLAALSPRPRSVAGAQTGPLRRRLAHHLDARRYDVLVAAEAGPPGVVSDAAVRVRQLPVVLDGLEIAVAREAPATATTAAARLRRRLTWWKLRAFTAGLLRRARAATVPSEAERELVRPLAPSGRAVAVMPNSLWMDDYQVVHEPVAPATLTFAGSLAYAPNRDAVEHLIAEVFPVVRARLPGAVLQVVGSTAGAAVARPPWPPGVRFTGLVEDVRPLVAASTVSVAPIRVGSGTRLKVIESLALGTPVVSTTKGAEGLGLDDGAHLLLADDPVTFAGRIVDVLEHPDLRRRLSAAGTRVATARFDARRLRAPMTALLEEARASTAGTGRRPAAAGARR